MVVVMSIENFLIKNKELSKVRERHKFLIGQVKTQKLKRKQELIPTVHSVDIELRIVCVSNDSEIQLHFPVVCNALY